MTLTMTRDRERQRRIEEGYYEELEIDDILRETSLEGYKSPCPTYTAEGSDTVTDILSDPDIHRIPWHQLEIGERIGIGASGIVTAARWTQYALCSYLLWFLRRTREAFELQCQNCTRERERERES